MTTRKVIGFSLYPQHTQYLDELYNQGFNKSAVVRNALELHQQTFNENTQNDQQGGANNNEV